MEQFCKFLFIFGKIFLTITGNTYNIGIVEKKGGERVLGNDFEVKKIYKGGVLIPKEYRDMLGLKDGESVIVMKKGNFVVIERLESYFEQKEN